MTRDHKCEHDVIAPSVWRGSECHTGNQGEQEKEQQEQEEEAPFEVFFLEGGVPL